MCPDVQGGRSLGIKRTRWLARLRSRLRRMVTKMTSLKSLSPSYIELSPRHFCRTPLENAKQPSKYERGNSLQIRSMFEQSPEHHNLVDLLVAGNMCCAFGFGGNVKMH
jgi:hypothetical protein